MYQVSTSEMYKKLSLYLTMVEMAETAFSLYFSGLPTGTIAT